MTEEEIYKKAIEKWGISTQVMMAMGECGELTAELNAFFNQGKSSIERVVDEIADVEIMCAQLRLIVGAKAVEDRKAFKVERLSKILSGDIKHPHA